MSLDGNTISFNLCANQTLRELKQVIYDKEVIPSAKKLLVYFAKVLVNSRELANYNISNGSTTHLSLRLPGGHSLLMKSLLTYLTETVL